MKAKIETPESLKDTYPLYPTVRRQEEDKDVVFSTLVRKRYNKIYYLIPMKFKGDTEAKAIHGLHSNVYQYLMLGVLTKEDIIDSDQTNEITRLKNL